MTDVTPMFVSLIVVWINGAYYEDGECDTVIPGHDYHSVEEHLSNVSQMKKEQDPLMLMYDFDMVENYIHEIKFPTIYIFVKLWLRYIE